MDSPESTNSIPRYLTIEELAAATTLSVSTIRRLIKSRRLPTLQPGGRRHRLLFSLAAVAQALAATPTPNEPLRRPTEAAPRPARGPKPNWMKSES